MSRRFFPFPESLAELVKRSHSRATGRGYRHVISPPELLEPRNAPGALLPLPTLTELSEEESFDLFSTMLTPEESRAATGDEKLLSGKGLSDANQNSTLQVDQDWWSLLHNDSGQDAAAVDSAFAAERPSQPLYNVDDSGLDLLGIVGPTVDRPAVKLAFAAEAPSKVETQSESVTTVPPPVRPSPAPAAPSGKQTGTPGGGSSGGGHAVQAPVLQSAATTAASVAKTAPVVSAPVVAAPQSAPKVVANSAAASVTSSGTVAASPAPVAPQGVAPAVPAPAPVAAVQAPVASTPKVAAVLPAPVPVVPVPVALTTPMPTPADVGPVIEADEVEQLLDRASAATSRTDAIIAVVDRRGQILGVRVEEDVPITDQDTLVFAIDGAVAKARTAAFFSSDSAPLTSRTVRFISQSTMTEREVESNPNVEDLTSTIRGPGFVAPIGLGGHFPPGVMFTPQVDLFAIEHTNRDSVIHPGLDLLRGTPDDVDLMTRFRADFAAGQDIPAPESYGFASGLLPNAQSRGIATLPGGVPLYKRDSTNPNGQALVGGIGVFFPGPDGYATFEQNFQPGTGQDPADRLNAPLVLEAEYSAVVAALNTGPVGGVAPLTDYVLKPVRIDLAGITLEGIGPHPTGLKGLLAFGGKLPVGTPNGTNQQVNTGGDPFIAGESVPSGWLVEPQASANLTADEVRQIIEDGVAEAERVRAAIRPLGSRTRMVVGVTDTDGTILGLFRMEDATFFSIDVAVAKARNVAYYADPNDLQSVDQVDANFDGSPEVAKGTAFTNRTFRYLSTPFFPTGVDTAPSGPFSILNDPGINPKTAENVGAPLGADEYTSVLGYDAFNPGTNFRELDDAGAVVGNQNGIVFFPGSTPLYKNGVLVGGLGVSGDGVDQDDVVTFGGAGDFRPGLNETFQRADEIFVRGVRLPYQKFNRNPLG